MLQGGFKEAIRVPLLVVVGDPGISPEKPIVTFLEPFPNPTAGAFSVKIHLTGSTAVELFLTDLAGRLVQSWDCGILCHSDSLVPDLEMAQGISRGTYMLHVKSSLGSGPSRVLVRE